MLETLNKLGYYTQEFTHFKTDYEYLDMQEETIVLFDTVGDFSRNKYYEKNYDGVNNIVEKEGFNFVFLPCVNFPKSTDELIQYLIPHLHNKLDFVWEELVDVTRSQEKDDLKYFKSYAYDSKKLLSYLGYLGNVDSGFLVITKYKSFVVKYTNRDIENGLKDPFYELFNVLRNEREHQENNLLTSRHSVKDYKKNFLDNIEEDLESDVKEKLHTISKQLELLKKNNQLMFILPLLNDKLEQLKDDIDMSAVSGISVNDEYQIILPYFNNMEIPLNSLTKALYILFTRYPEGIFINTLEVFYNELLDIYLNVSNKDNLDQMKQSVKDVLDVNTKAIYPHISRIKSTFYKIMDSQFAEQYIISSDGHGTLLRFIPVLYNNRNNQEPENLKDLIC